MSAEERAIAADAASGRQHAVILTEETLRDESGTESVIAYHLRAKILSADARSLADVVIPLDPSEDKVSKWWGRTIHSDGRVLELKREELQEQVLAQQRGTKLRALKAALPGVEPGSIIDYGYVVRYGGLSNREWVPLQREWPVRRLRYEWVPWPNIPSQYMVRRQPGVTIDVKRDRNSVIIEASDLPLFVEEDYAPPDDVIRAGAILFYNEERRTDNPASFWNEVARDEETALAEFLKKDKMLKEVLQQMSLPQDASLEARLRRIDEWIDANILNRTLRTAEQAEQAREVNERKDWQRMAYAAREKNTAEDVLRRREAWQEQVISLFIGFARASGAEADLVLATDREENVWDTQLLTASQFSGRLVAVREPGQPDDKAIILAPGTGYPFMAIPYWYTPGKALRATAEGAREIQLKSSAARDNVLETRAAISFTEESLAHVVWSERGTGQRGMLDRLGLRLSNPEERATLLDEACGASGDFEIARAELADLEKQRAEYRLECEGDLVNVSLDETSAGFIYGINGPWIPALPEFHATTRVHHIVMPHPFIDTSTVEIESPDGFVPEEAPQPVKYQSPYGSYGLQITKSKTGYKVERAVAVTALFVAPENYATMRGFFEKVRTADRIELRFRREAGGS